MVADLRYWQDNQREEDRSTLEALMRLAVASVAFYLKLEMFYLKLQG